MLILLTLLETSLVTTNRLDMLEQNPLTVQEPLEAGFSGFQDPTIYLKNYH